MCSRKNDNNTIKMENEEEYSSSFQNLEQQAELYSDMNLNTNMVKEDMTIEVKPSTSEIDGECQNCKNCICKDWASFVTPEFISLLQMQVNAFQTALNLTHVRTLSKDATLEIYPGTGVSITQSQLDWVLAKSNGNKRALVRNLLLKIMTEDELVQHRTAETLNKNNPAIRTAVIGFLRSKCMCDLSITEYNDVVNKKMQVLRTEKRLTPAERACLKEKRRKSARESRLRKKLYWT